MLPPNLRAEAPRQRSFQIQSMLSAFQLNLSALSMVSLLVGVFLIYNTISASVARRRVEIGILRSIGATRAEVRWLFLSEACIFGILGIALGAGAGVVLARTLSGAVAKTISSHYVLLSIDRTWLSPGQFAAALAYGLLAVLAGAWLPAGEASRIEPVQALISGAYAEHSLARPRRWGVHGIASLAIAGVASWLALNAGPPAWGFAACFCILAGFAFFAPDATLLFGAVRHAVVVHGNPLAGRSGQSSPLAASQRRDRGRSRRRCCDADGTRGDDFLFRSSVDSWIHRGIIADLYIAPASNETTGFGAFVPPAAIEWLKARPEISGVDTFREMIAPVSIRGAAPQPSVLVVVQGEYRNNLSFAGGHDAEKMDASKSGRRHRDHRTFRAKTSGA